MVLPLSSDVKIALLFVSVKTICRWKENEWKCQVFSSPSTYRVELWMRHKKIHRRVDDGVRLVELELFGLIEERVAVIIRNENCETETTRKRISDERGEITINSLVDGAVMVVLGSSFGPSGGSRAKHIMTSEPSPSQCTISWAWESLSALCWWVEKKRKQRKTSNIEDEYFPCPSGFSYELRHFNRGVQKKTKSIVKRKQFFFVRFIKKFQSMWQNFLKNPHMKTSLV